MWILIIIKNSHSQGKLQNDKYIAGMSLPKKTNENRYVHQNLPRPSSLQTTDASTSPQLSSHTEPQRPLKKISTLPLSMSPVSHLCRSTGC